MKLLLTGSAGLIGACVLHVLQARGDNVVEFDVRPRHANGPALDVRSIERVREAATGCDGIIHLAAISRVVSAEIDPTLCGDVNVGGTRNVCQVASESSRRPFVIFASSREVYGNPGALPVTESDPLRPCNVYGRSKAEGERLVTELGGAGVNAAVLRLPNVYGSVLDHPDRVVPAFARRAALGGSIVVNGPDGMFDFVHADDAARAIVTQADRLASGARLPPIHLASGIGTTLGELAELAVAASIRPLEVRTGPRRNHDVERFVGDPGLAQALLGWACKTSLEAGFRRLVQQFAEDQA